MWVLRIDHGVADFDRWKGAFDSDPVGRAQGGVTAYRVLRRRDEHNHVSIDLEFETSSQAEAFRERLEQLWQRVEREGLITGPRAELLEEVDARPRG
jgi:hypothetical protein